MSSLPILLLTTSLLSAQTAEELVAKNLQARGGAEKIKAIKTLRMTGKVQQGPITIQLVVDSMAPNFLRQMATIQGMTQVQAWVIMFVVLMLILERSVFAPLERRAFAWRISHA